MAESTISYKLDTFEGPLDLLLHLIDRDKINIYDIPIARITEQYLEYMNSVPEIDLDAMSDFLVMAATLLDIKARMLLPKEIDPETGEEVDPRTELVQRLIEHRKYSMMAEELAGMEQDAGRHLYKVPTIPPEVAKYEMPVDMDKLLGDVDLAMLKKIFEQAVKRRDDRIDPERSKFGTIKKEKISLETRLNQLISYTKENRRFLFKKLLEGQHSKVETVVTFLAVLELTKVGILHLEQDGSGQDIQIDVVDTEKEIELDLSDLGDFES